MDRIPDVEESINKKNFAGLYAVSSPQDQSPDGADEKADLFLFHDLHGHPYHSWFNTKEKLLWPKHLCSKLQGFRLWSFGYTTGRTEAFPVVELASRTFGEYFRRRILDDHIANAGRKIYFLAIGKGGIVVKKILIDCRAMGDDPKRVIWDHSNGIIFLDTPHSWYDVGEENGHIPTDNSKTELGRINEEYSYMQLVVPFALDVTSSRRPAFRSKKFQPRPGAQLLEYRPKEGYLMLDASKDWYNSLDLDSPVYTKICSQIEQWYKKPPKPSVSSDGRQGKPRGLRLLSIDGGGVRGLCSLLILRALMRAIWRIETRRRPDTENDYRSPADFFDLAGGTSAGGLICIMLFRLNMDIQSAIDSYRTLAPKIFRRHWSHRFGGHWIKLAMGIPLFRGECLEEAVRDLIYTRLPTPEALKLSSDQEPDEVPLRRDGDVNGPKMFVCAVESRENREDQCMRFRNYGNQADSGCKIWEAARATSAAPFYFPKCSIDGIDYYDGGVLANNPIHQVWLEKDIAFPQNGVSCIVSLGNGLSTTPTKVSKPLIPAFGILKDLLRAILGTEHKHKEFEEIACYNRVQYVRFNPLVRGYSIGLADHTMLGAVEEYTESYLRNPKVEERIERIALTLARW